MADHRDPTADREWSGMLPVRVVTTPSPIRALVIDLGTNSFHAVIVDAHANGSFDVLDRRKELVDLGSVGLSRHWLSDEAMDRALRVLSRIKILGEGWAAEEHLAFATSAIREARNGGEFLDRVRRKTGITVRPISGEREAGLIYEGVRIAVDIPEPALILDIGGGSTEFVIGTSRQNYFSASLKLGAARLTEQYISEDPLGEAALVSLKEILHRQLEPVFAIARAYNVETLIGSSGAAENLAQAVVDRVGDTKRSIYQQQIKATDLTDLLRELLTSSRAQRLEIQGIDAKRVDQIVAAAALVQVLLEELPVGQIKISPYALREGMVVHFIQQNHERLEQLAPFGDVRRRSINQLGFKCQWEVRHAQKVADLAIHLFEVCSPIHGLGPNERELLEYASLLHDIGYHISRSDHHKHSQYILAHADLNGFQPEEIEAMSLIVRYHAGSLPKESHAGLKALDADQRDRILKLAAILRIAEGLDRSHFQNVRHVEASIERGRLCLTLQTESDPEMDLWGGRRGADLFEAVFGLRVEIEIGDYMSSSRDR